MGVVLTNATAQHPIRISGVTLLIPFDGDSLRPARPKAQIKFNTAGLEHIVTVWKVLPRTKKRTTKGSTMRGVQTVRRRTVLKNGQLWC